MQQPDPKIRQQLLAAHDLFTKKQYSQCKKVLSQVKTPHLSIELNSLLCQFKEDHGKLQSVLRKIMDILVAVNIKIYKQRPQKGNKRTPKISHQFYFWNIMVLSQLLPNPEITQLVGSQALHFVDSLRTQTSLMILYQMLKTKETSGRLASCISLIEKQNMLISRVKKLTSQQQQYRFLNQILFCKVLLKLGMIDGGRIMYMMKFNQNLQEPKQGQITEINGLHISIHQQLLHAQIEYHAKNYQHSLKILGQLMGKVDGLGKWKQQVKNIIDHNIALVLFNYRQTACAKVMLSKTLTFLIRDKENSNQKAGMIAKCRDNLLITSLASPSKNYQSEYEALKSHHNCYSYKLSYRKAQLCLNYYHQLLKNPSRTLTYQEIHDFYQTVYYYPNLPYFQQKGKNRNPNYTNNKFSYRRYVVHESQNGVRQQFYQEQKKQMVKVNVNANGNKEGEVKKEKSKEKKGVVGKKKGKKQEQPKEEMVKQEVPEPVQNEQKSKLNQILQMCQTYLKQSLIILQRQKSIIVNLKDQQKGLTEQVNEKLYSQFITYKSSIFNLLCYIYLCKQEWHQTIHYASLYQTFQKQYQLQIKKTPHQKTFYTILTYKLQAYTQLNRIDKAYQLLHQLAGCVDYGDIGVMSCVSSGQKSGVVYFQDMNQFNNFGFNLSVLHSKDNKIPEAYNSIQKLLQQMRQIPTNPKANLPLSLLQLLIHYNLRTSNHPSALQLIKRRRILNLPGVIGHYNPILNITK